jgi:hypothetical protein
MQLGLGVGDGDVARDGVEEIHDYRA